MLQNTLSGIIVNISDAYIKKGLLENDLSKQYIDLDCHYFSYILQEVNIFRQPLSFTSSLS